MAAAPQLYADKGTKLAPEPNVCQTVQAAEQVPET